LRHIIYTALLLTLCMNVIADEQLKRELKTEEGERLCQYRDSNGNPTIGVGTCLSKKCGGKEAAEKVIGKFGNCISKSQSEKLLNYHIEKHKRVVQKRIGNVKHSAAKWRALVKISFIRGHLPNWAIAGKMNGKICSAIGKNRCSKIQRQLNN